MADRSSNVLTHLADRRHAVRTLGTTSAAILAALGLGGVTGEARDRGDSGKGTGQSDRNQRTRHTRDQESASRPADRNDELAEPGGEASATEPVKSDTVRVQRKRRRPTRVNGEPSEPLAAENGGLVFSHAVCPGGNGKLLSGGYIIDATAAQLANVVVDEVGPDNDVSTFTVVLRCPIGSQCTAGATITALAICKG